MSEYLTKEEVKSLPIGTPLIVEEEIIRSKKFIQVEGVGIENLFFPKRKIIINKSVFYTGYGYAQTYTTEDCEDHPSLRVEPKEGSIFCVKGKSRPAGREFRFNGLRVKLKE